MGAQLLSAALGFWLMAAPGWFGYAGPASVAHHIAGPLIASFGLTAAWEVTRALRWANFAVALVMLTATLVVRQNGAAIANGVTVGLLVSVLSLVRGGAKHSLGGGWRMLWTRGELQNRRAQRTL